MRTLLNILCAALALALLGTTASIYAERSPISASAGLITSNPCITGTSTIFAIQNPTGATSTVTYAALWGTQGATTTDILIATSTTSAPPGLAVATTSINETVVGMFAVPTSTQFFTVAGQTIGPGTGYTSPSGATYVTHEYTVVGPSEWLIGFSTSTYGGNRNGGLAASSLAIPVSCTYKFIWTQ